MTTTRLTISPTQSIINALERRWPLHVPRHRLMRLALERGLEQLARLKADEFRRLVVDDAVSTAGIHEPLKAE
jgi:hypothetical protein